MGGNELRRGFATNFWSPRLTCNTDFMDPDNTRDVRVSAG